MRGHCRNIQTWRKFDTPEDYLACIAYIQQLVSEGEFELMQKESTCPLEKIKTKDGWVDKIMAHMIQCKHCDQIFAYAVNAWRGSRHPRRSKEWHGQGGEMMSQTEEAELLEQLRQWNKKDEYSRCIQAIEAIPERERGYLLTVKLSQVYNNLAVLGDHGEHGTNGGVGGDLIRHATELLEPVRAQGENDPYWSARIGYPRLMAYHFAASAYEYAKHWLALILDDSAAQKLVQDCEEYLEKEKALELGLKDREEIIREETPDDVKKGGYL